MVTLVRVMMVGTDEVSNGVVSSSFTSSSGSSSVAVLDTTSTFGRSVLLSAALTPQKDVVQSHQYKKNGY